MNNIKEIIKMRNIRREVLNETDNIRNIIVDISKEYNIEDSYINSIISSINIIEEKYEEWYNMISIKTKVLLVLNKIVVILDDLYFEKYNWNCIDWIIFKLNYVIEYIEEK